MLSLAGFATAATLCGAAARVRSATRAKKSEKPRFVRVPLEELPKLQNDLILRAARGEPVDRAPVWIMRQAGRYLPEYMALRVMSDFFKVCQDPELASEVTMQPIRRYPGLDAAIIFSDILVVPQAMGMECRMVPGRGPVFPNPLRSPDQLRDLDLAPDAEAALGYVYDAVNLTRQKLGGRVPLFGFCGSPWTLMVYMVEGGGSKAYAHCRRWIYKHPEESHRLLSAITALLADHLALQAEAGAQLLQVFDSAGGELPPAEYRAFSAAYMLRLAAAVRARCPDVPLVAFPRGAHHSLSLFRDSAFDVVQVDWSIDPRVAREAVGPEKTLQGNVDPMALLGGRPSIRAAVEANIAAFGGPGAPRYIANLGHGVTPFHTPEQVGEYIDAVHEFSTRK